MLPIQHNQMTEFNTDENLKKIQLFKGNRVQHNEVKTKTSNCSLCSRGTVQRNTVRKCDTCGVPICTTSLEKDGDRCFDLWHQTEDLEQCSTDTNTRLKLHREKNMGTYQAQMSKANAQKSGNIRTICKNSLLQNRDQSPGSTVLQTGTAAAGETNTADTCDSNIVNNLVVAFDDINIIDTIKQV